jgi:large subunit ribosomal protein L28
LGDISNLYGESGYKIEDCVQEKSEIFVMSRRCDLTGKKANNAFAISHSHRRTKRLQEANLQSKRVWWEQGNRWVRLRLSTKAIKTLTTRGVDAMAKEAGINLNKY